MSDYPNLESISETSKSHQTHHKERLVLPEESSSRLLIPKHPLKRQSSIESLFSGSDVSEHFVSHELDDSYGHGTIRTNSIASATLNSLSGSSTWKTTLHEFWIVNYGAFLVLLSQVFGAGMNVCTRLLETPGPHGEPMHPFQILFARQSITTLITTVYALRTQSVPDFPFGPPGRVRLLLISRGLFGFLGVFGLYFSLLYLPISEATILTFLAPIGSCIAFALLIPGETFSRHQMLAGLISLLGVVFIARPVSLFKGTDSDSIVPQLNVTMSVNGTLSDADAFATPQPTPAQHLQAVGVAMIGVVGAIGALSSIRAIGQRAHALLSVNYFSAWCTFVSLVALLVIPSVKFRLPGNMLEWGLLFILGFAGFIMQLLLTKGMAYGARANLKAQQPAGLGDLEMQPHIAIPQPNTTNILTSAASQIGSDGSKGMPKIKSSGAKATSMLYTQMLFALASDKIVFGITPGIWSWFGSGLILFGAIWVAADSGPKSTGKEPNAVTLHDRQTDIVGKHDSSSHEGAGLLSNFDESSSHSQPPEWTPRPSTDR